MQIIIKDAQWLSSAHPHTPPEVVGMKTSLGFKKSTITKTPHLLPIAEREKVGVVKAPSVMSVSCVCSLIIRFRLVLNFEVDEHMIMFARSRYLVRQGNVKIRCIYVMISWQGLHMAINQGIVWTVWMSSLNPLPGSCGIIPRLHMLVEVCWSHSDSDAYVQEFTTESWLQFSFSSWMQVVREMSRKANVVDMLGFLFFSTTVSKLTVPFACRNRRDCVLPAASIDGLFTPLSIPRWDFITVAAIRLRCPSRLLAVRVPKGDTKNVSSAKNLRQK